MIHGMEYVYNKKAKFNYEILDTYEAGIELTGGEVKAIRAKKCSLEGSRVTVRGGEAFLLGATIHPFQIANTETTYNEVRNRRLLLNKKELRALSHTEETQGLTLIPISLYNKGRNIKIQIATARGKKQFDKRETIKKRETDREIRREIKRR